MEQCNPPTAVDVGVQIVTIAPDILDADSSSRTTPHLCSRVATALTTAFFKSLFLIIFCVIIKLPVLLEDFLHCFLKHTTCAQIIG